MQQTDLQEFTNWMAGENEVRSPVRSRSHDPEVTLVQASIIRSAEPQARLSQSFPHLTVQLLTRGRLPFRADLGCGRFFAVATPGAFIVTPPGQPCDIKTGADFESLGLALPWPLVEDLIAPAYDGAIPDLAPVYAGLARSERVSAAMMALWLEVSVVGAPGRLLFQAEVLKVLGGLLQIVARPAEARATGGLSPLQLARACEFIEANLREDITLTRLAASAGLHRPISAGPSGSRPACHRSPGCSNVGWNAPRLCWTGRTSAWRRSRSRWALPPNPNSRPPSGVRPACRQVPGVEAALVS